MNNLKNILPPWGPYSKKYMGISRVMENEKTPGVRFDCVVFPTITNSGVPVPNVTIPSNYHPWKCSEDFGFFSYRYELECRDKIYADISFTRIDESSRLLRVEFVNQTDFKQILLLNLFNAIEYPQKSYANLTLPQKSTAWDALDYSVYNYSVKRPWDHLNPDGAKKGEFFDENFVNGKGLGDRVDHRHVSHLVLKPFGAAAGDLVSYDVEIKESYINPVLCIRYRTVDENPASFSMRINNSKHISGNESEITLPPGKSLDLHFIGLKDLTLGVNRFEFISLGTGGVEFDFLAILESDDIGSLIVEQKTYNLVPKADFSHDNCMRYSYENFEETSIEMQVLDRDIRFREINTGALEDCLISRLSNSDVTFDDVTSPFSHSFQRKHSDTGFYHNIIIHSIYAEPKDSEVVYVVISDVKNSDKTKKELTLSSLEDLYQNTVLSLKPHDYSEAGKKYELCTSILQATTLTNILYPIYKKGGYVKHFSPGKRWDCLYTWDSGFIGLGFIEYAKSLSEYVLDMYLGDTENTDFAFLHHGSPVPVLIYLFFEMLKSTNNKKDLYVYYDRSKQMYDFLAGKIWGSTTSRFKTGLTSTYDYFYNSSGMDDLPPQVFMHINKLQGVTTPSIAASQLIRCAKMLRIVAAKASKLSDISEFDSDIEKLSSALQTYSWDGEAGYFSYVVHDENFNFKHLLKSETGENLDKGMDGIYPLIAGACTENQKEILLSHLKSTKEMFSSVGISAVDMSSSYFRHNGYWNGNVWFAHQWFIWKTMLDLNQMDFAFKIAETALDAWKEEVDYSHYTFEMLNIETGRGGWFHNFSGLSTPISVWANAYYKPGTVSSGFDMWIESLKFTNDNKNCKIDFENHSGKNQVCGVIVVMNDKFSNYAAFLNGKAVNFTERLPGVIEISLTQGQGSLVIGTSQKPDKMKVTSKTFWK